MMHIVVEGPGGSVCLAQRVSRTRTTCTLKELLAKPRPASFSGTVVILCVPQSIINTSPAFDQRLEAWVWAEYGPCDVHIVLDYRTEAVYSWNPHTLYLHYDVAADTFDV